MSLMNIWAAVESETARLPALDVLAPRRCAAIAARLIDAFDADPEFRWWSGALRANVPATSVQYGDRDAWALLRAWLPAGRSFVLLVTDEDAAPAGAVKG